MSIAGLYYLQLVSLPALYRWIEVIILKVIIWNAQNTKILNTQVDLLLLTKVAFTQ